MQANEEAQPDLPTASAGKLVGVRVVDLGRNHAASVAALMLAECAAEVIKVSLSGWPSGLTEVQATIWNRSKAPLVLDLASEKDRTCLNTMLDGADVVLHDFTPAEARQLRLDDDALLQGRLHLIVSAVTGWPQGHPKADRKVSDVLVLGEVGILDEQAAVGRDGPVFLRFPLGAWHAAGLAVAAILVRLIMRERGRPGGIAHTSLLQGALIPQMMHWARAERPSHGMGGWPKDHPATLFECSDGKWIHVMGQPVNAPLVRAAIDAMTPGQREQALARYVNVPIPFLSEWGAVEAVFKTRPRDEWLEHLWQSDVPVQAVERPGTIFQDEQAKLNGYVVEIDTEAFGKTLQPGVPFDIDPRPAPRAGVPVFAEWKPREAGSDSFGADLEAAPLAGLKVVDFGNYLAGPLAAMLLADLGASVVKVEMPSGDPMRPVAWAFNGCQRGKRTLALQLKDASAWPVIERLVRSADVVHHNLRLPVAEKLGIGYETLKGLNPRLVYSHVSSYGRFGPRKDWPGYDQLFQAATGWEYEGAGGGNPPMWHRFGMMDHLAALSSLNVTLLALLERERTGEGQFVAASLLGSSLFTLDSMVGGDGQLVTGPALDARQLGLSTTHRLYRCSDGWIALHDLAEDAERRLLEALEVDQVARIESRLESTTTADALAALEHARIPAVRVGLAQRNAFFDDPDNKRVGLSTSYVHPQYGRLEQPGAFWDFGREIELRPTVAPPLFGQHSREILAELGFSNDEVDALIERKTVVQE